METGKLYTDKIVQDRVCAVEGPGCSRDIFRQADCKCDNACVLIVLSELTSICAAGFAVVFDYPDVFCVWLCSSWKAPRLEGRFHRLKLAVIRENVRRRWKKRW